MSSRQELRGRVRLQPPFCFCFCRTIEVHEHGPFQSLLPHNVLSKTVNAAIVPARDLWGPK